MKIAFLIMAHTDPRQLHRLLHALDDPRFDLFVHLDKKSDKAAFRLEEVQLRHSRLVLIPKRVKVYWADISQVEAMLALYRCALKEGDYQRFVMLSGIDYPTVSNDTIYRTLTQTDRELVTAPPISQQTHLRVTGYSFWKLQSPYWINRIQMSLYDRNIRKNTWLTVGGRRWEVYLSATWHCLSREAVEHILATLKKYPQILRYFRYAHGPDEMFISTILGNSPEFASRLTPFVRKNKEAFDDRPVLHYVRYAPINRDGRRISSIRTFDESDFESIRDSGKLFVRKVTTEDSGKLLDLLDQNRKDR